MLELQDLLAQQFRDNVVDRPAIATQLFTSLAMAESTFVVDPSILEVVIRGLCDLSMSYAQRAPTVFARFVAPEPGDTTVSQLHTLSIEAGAERVVRRDGAVGGAVGGGSGGGGGRSGGGGEGGGAAGNMSGSGSGGRIARTAGMSIDVAAAAGTSSSTARKRGISTGSSGSNSDGSGSST